MQKIKLPTAYLEHIVKLGLAHSVKRLEFHLNFLFKEINFKDKNVLDIGGGVGLHSIYAACMGARKVICLEPELEGSSGGLNEKFSSINSELDLKNAYFIQETFQEYEPSDIFDVVILHNSINHLNENACIKLKKDKSAQEEYKKYFRKLFQMTQSGSKVIICDCTDKNFFNLVGLKNPFAPTIEWEKHQSPKVWVNLLEECGFKKEKIKWSSFNILGKFGNLILGNKFFSYFLCSHFCLFMTRV